MNTPIDLDDSISKIEEVIRRHECPESIKEHVMVLIRYTREAMKSLDVPSDESLMAQLYKRAAKFGTKVKDMTLIQIAEVIKDIDLRRVSAQRSKRDEKRRRRK